MKKLFALVLFLAPVFAFAQGVPLPNISWNGLLTSACTNTNSACPSGVFVTSGTPASPGPLGSGSTLDVPTSNYSVATVQVSGTYSGVTLAFDFSDPAGGTNYYQELCARTDVNLLEANEVLPSNQVRAWQCPIIATTRFRVRASAFGTGAVNVWITVTQSTVDPSPTIAQQGSGQGQSAFITLSTNTTTQVIAAPASGYHFYVTGVQLNTTTAGTGTTVQIEYGTGTNCASSPTALTPAYSNTATGVVSYTFHPNSPLIPGLATAICAVQAGTTAGTTQVLIVGYTAP